MSESMVLTLIGPDRPGLVDALSTTIAEHDGNWLESRMSRLAGKFAGILRLTVPEDRAGSLREELGRMQKLGLTVVIEGNAPDAIKDPLVLHKMDALEQHMAGLPPIGGCCAIHRYPVSHLSYHVRIYRPNALFNGFGQIEANFGVIRGYRQHLGDRQVLFTGKGYRLCFFGNYSFNFGHELIEHDSLLLWE